MKKIILIIIILAGVNYACNDRLEDLNQPVKDPTDVPAQTLFTNAIREVFDMMVSTNVNENNYRLYAQYWAQTTYPDESQYNMVSRNIPDNVYRNAYREALRDFRQARLNLEKIDLDDPLTDVAQVQNQLGAIDLSVAYTYAVLVDLFGHVPYSEAMDAENLNPKYDDQVAVYDAVIAKIDAALSLMDGAAGGFVSSQDPVANGDASGWITFGNSLKMRIGMRLADVDPAKSKTLVAQAIAGGIISSNSENIDIDYQEGPPSTNPLYEDLVLSGRRDFVPANTFVDKLNTLNDPRRDVYFTDKIGGEYVGGVYGSANAYNNSSHLGDIFFQPDFEGTIINYSEMMFLMAEAAERGGYTGVTETAEYYYNEGIKASFSQWGVSMDDYDAYIVQPSVAYTTADGNWKQKIGSQMWISLYNQGFEGWTTWRRLDFAGFNVPAGLEYADIPVRLIYPINEATRNGTNVKDAGARMGGDDVQAHIFWDMN